MSSGRIECFVQVPDGDDRTKVLASDRPEGTPLTDVLQSSQTSSSSQRRLPALGTRRGQNPGHEACWAFHDRAHSDADLDPHAAEHLLVAPQARVRP